MPWRIFNARNKTLISAICLFQFVILTFFSLVKCKCFFDSLPELSSQSGRPLHRSFPSRHILDFSHWNSNGWQSVPLITLGFDVAVAFETGRQAFFFFPIGRQSILGHAVSGSWHGWPLIDFCRPELFAWNVGWLGRLIELSACHHNGFFSD